MRSWGVTAHGGALAHVSVPGPGPYIAYGLFFAGIGAAFGAYSLSRRDHAVAARVGLTVLAVGCFGLATVLPFLISPGPAFVRPSSTAHIQILSPQPGEVFSGNPATIDVRIRLEGGRVVPITSTRLVSNEGHIHLLVDGSLVTMTGVEARITAAPGSHTLQAEFVAVDHAPFRPRVVAAVTFRVQG
jgi:hypothetical protein